MAESGGFWLNLAEAQRLTQAFLVPGVIEEHIRRGGVFDRFPLAQSTGTRIEWNREKGERTAQEVAIGGQLVWTDNVDYTPVNRDLKILYDQTPLDKFVSSVYGTMVNYEAVTHSAMVKGMLKRLEDRLIYGDTTFSNNSLQFDGFHAWGRENGQETDGTNLDIDEGGALSLANLRLMEDTMKLGVDFILMPYEIARRLDSFYQEAGIGDSNRSNIGSFIWSVNDVGRRVPFWNGIEIVRSDYMVAEQAGTGEGNDAKAKFTSGTREYSIFMIKLGQVMLGEGGMTIAFGGATNELGEVFKTTFFDTLEDFDAAGIRLTSYVGTLCGSKYGCGRIHGITDAAVTE